MFFCMKQRFFAVLLTFGWFSTCALETHRVLSVSGGGEMEINHQYTRGELSIEIDSRYYV